MNLHEKNIRGMHYVRVIKDDNGERGGYLLIDNKNKPVTNVYRYLKHCKGRGNSLNTLKSKVFDLSYFFDYMMIMNIDEELVSRENLIHFITEYLKKINPYPEFADCIERSFSESIPWLHQYGDCKIIAPEQFISDGLDNKRICRILNNVKEYIVFLHDYRGLKVRLRDIFDIKVVRFKNNSMLGYLSENTYAIYTVDRALKASSVFVKRKFINPIEPNVIFEPKEEEIFFYTLKKYFNISYQLLFYLLRKTGMRISEALSLRINNIPAIGANIDFKSIVCDISLVDDDEDAWQVDIKVRPDDPPDIRIKGNKPRKIAIIDSTKEFRFMLTQLLIFRAVLMKKNKSTHDFLFINRSGNRLKSSACWPTFTNILNRSNLAGRKGQLVIHSFRHTFASNWIRVMKLHKADVELAELGRYLGHSSHLVTLDTYIHLFSEDMRDILGKLERSKHFKEDDDYIAFPTNE